jgi:hypothetical protein
VAQEAKTGFTSFSFSLHSVINLTGFTTELTAKLKNVISAQLKDTYPNSVVTDIALVTGRVQVSVEATGPAVTSAALQAAVNSKLPDIISAVANSTKLQVASVSVQSVTSSFYLDFSKVSPPITEINGELYAVINTAVDKELAVSGVTVLDIVIENKSGKVKVVTQLTGLPADTSKAALDLLLNFIKSAIVANIKETAAYSSVITVTDSKVLKSTLNIKVDGVMGLDSQLITSVSSAFKFVLEGSNVNIEDISFAEGQIQVQVSQTVNASSTTKALDDLLTQKNSAIVDEIVRLEPSFNNKVVAAAAALSTTYLFLTLNDGRVSTFL